ncbi:MAG: penicillin-binding protein activator LpoB [Candidatus Aminicenantes bacterium]|nr:penicillin-binding protein activator LpoB [Candidatus Aminicenantes bacterium]MBL7082582.1 penicillin-binding protein activator LpoB [Candidatus Aminicenantes bacterium]
MRNITLLLLTGSILFTGCGGGVAVQRIATDEVTDLSGKWNDTDSRLVAEKMVADMMSRIWLPNFLKEKGKNPTVIVGTIRNMSTEHVNMQVFTKDIERELINSGRVQFVASKREREEIRDERVDQQTYASLETAKRLGQEYGADFVLIGTFKSVEDVIERKKAILYSVDLELIDVEKNLKVWIGNKKIKKLIKRAGVKW